MSGKNPIADEWKNIFQTLGMIEHFPGTPKQLVVRHVKAHVTEESRGHMEDKMGKISTSLETPHQHYNERTTRPYDHDTSNTPTRFGALT